MWPLRPLGGATPLCWLQLLIVKSMNDSDRVRSAAVLLSIKDAKSARSRRNIDPV